MSRVSAALRFLLIIPTALAILCGTLFFDGYLAEALFERCPLEAYQPGDDSMPPRCEDARLSALSYWGMSLAHVLAVMLLIGSIALFALEEKFMNALYMALFSTWLVLGIAVLISGSDGFDFPENALALQQFMVLLWAGLCVYFVRKRFRTEPRPSTLEIVILGLLVSVMAVPYWLVLGLSFSTLAIMHTF